MIVIVILSLTLYLILVFLILLLYFLENGDSLFHTRDAGDTKESLVVLLFQRTLLYVASGIVENLREHRAAIERTLHVAYKLHLHSTLFEHDLLAAQAFAEASQAHHVHQFLTLTGHRSKAVDDSLSVSSQVVIILYAVQFPVEQHSLATSRHIGVGEIHL